MRTTDDGLILFWLMTDNFAFDYRYGRRLFSPAIPGRSGVDWWAEERDAMKAGEKILLSSVVNLLGDSVHLRTTIPGVFFPPSLHALCPTVIALESKQLKADPSKNVCIYWMSFQWIALTFNCSANGIQFDSFNFLIFPRELSLSSVSSERYWRNELDSRVAAVNGLWKGFIQFATPNSLPKCRHSWAELRCPFPHSLVVPPDQRTPLEMCEICVTRLQDNL